MSTSASIFLSEISKSPVPVVLLCNSTKSGLVNSENYGECDGQRIFLIHSNIKAIFGHFKIDFQSWARLGFVQAKTGGHLNPLHRKPSCTG